MRVFKGIRFNGGRDVTVNGKPLNPCNNVRNHSPTGFEWGYAGSGPAQLALAICMAVLRDRHRAECVYQQFKFKVIEAIKDDVWELREEQVMEVIREIEEGHRASEVI